jgi:hypothetical protein
MTGFPGTDFFISRVCGLSAGIAGKYFRYAVELQENRFGTPETAAGEGRFFELGIHHKVFPKIKINGRCGGALT